MGREVKRVPLDFGWPLKEVWSGFLLPDRLEGASCPDCDGGLSPQGKYLQDRWYGYVPFDPKENGSRPFTPHSRTVWARAQWNIEQSPGYYGSGTPAVEREAKRLADLFNGQWSHHLHQRDVDALVAAGRLMDFTHTWSKETRWQPKDPMPEIKAWEVNRWSTDFGLGHDSINCWTVVRAECERQGVPYVCATCEGHGSVEKYPGQRAEQEAWEPQEPPTGEGWQMWENTTEGSPMSPVFASPEELATWLADTGASIFGSTTATQEEWFKVITGEQWGWTSPDMPNHIWI